MYSASVMEREMVSCLREFHIIAFPFIETRVPVWLRDSSPPYDASAYPTIFRVWSSFILSLFSGFCLFSVIPSSELDNRYCSTCVAAVIFRGEAFAVRLPSRFTCIEISGLVHRFMYKRLPTNDWYVFCCSGVRKSFSFNSYSFIWRGRDFVGFVIPCSFARFSIDVFCVSFTSTPFCLVDLVHVSSIPRSFFGIPNLSSST